MKICVFASNEPANFPIKRLIFENNHKGDDRGVGESEKFVLKGEKKLFLQKRIIIWERCLNNP